MLIGIIGFSIFIAVQPNTYRFSQSKVIKAPLSLIYTKATNSDVFKSLLEEDLELSVESVEVLDTKKNDTIKQLVNLSAPYKISPYTNWTFEKNNAQTKVTITMEGQQDFTTKFLAFFKGTIASKIEPSLEYILEKTDSALQTEMNRYSITIKGITEHGGGFYLYNTASSKLSNFEDKKNSMLSQVGGYALANNISIAGKLFVIYHNIDDDNDTVMFSCAIPTNSKITASDDDILTGKLEPFKAVKTVLNGDTKNIEEAWNKTMKYLAENNLETTEDATRLEIYVVEQSLKPNPADWITELFIAIK